MEINEKLIEDIVRKVLSESGCSRENFKETDKSGVIGIDLKKVVCEKFPFPIESDRVYLKDVLTLGESPRMGCGVMELDNTEFEWTLTYDEIDYIIEGTLEIDIDGRVISASAGEVIFIPKNTKIKFRTPNKTRFMYAVYPANWAD